MIKKEIVERWRDTIAAYAILLMVMLSCAVPTSPKGGPQDREPPLITYEIPENYSVNFTSRRITIGFNEYVQIKDQQKNVIISPPITPAPTLTVKGRSIVVDIDPRAKLDSATTYTINFGRAIVDNNEGNAMTGYSYVFSTGSYIDSLVMSGILVDAYKSDTLIGALVMLYNGVPDTIWDGFPELDSTLFLSKVAAVARTDSNGVFIAPNLKDQDYRVYAVYDENGNNSYEAGDKEMVGIIDSMVNPATLPPFKVWYNPKQRVINATPQLYFELFGETLIRRQNLSNITRPSARGFMFEFSAPFPKIDSLNLDGGYADSLIVSTTLNQDTIYYWLNTEVIPDTLKGNVVYHTTTGTGEDTLVSKKINLPFKQISTGGRQRDRGGSSERGQKGQRGGGGQQGGGERPDGPPEGQEQEGDQEQQEEVQEQQQERGSDRRRKDEETQERTPLTISVNASKTMSPETQISFTFLYPLIWFDTTKITLQEEIAMEVSDRMTREQRQQMEEQQKKPKEYTNKDIRFVQDSINILTWHMMTTMKEGLEYKLSIPDSVMVNVNREHNDSLGSTFTTLSAENSATLKINFKGDSTKLYIVELVQGKARTIKHSVKRVRPGLLELKYLPAGTYGLRIIEDVNGNDKWDAGSLVEGRISERIVMASDPATGVKDFALRENWEVEVAIDLDKLFPLTKSERDALVKGQEEQPQEEAVPEPEQSEPLDLEEELEEEPLEEQPQETQQEEQDEDEEEQE